MKYTNIIFILCLYQIAYTADVDIQISGNLKAIVNDSSVTDFEHGYFQDAMIGALIVTDSIDASTAEIKAATFTFEPSGVSASVQSITSEQDGYALILNYASKTMVLSPQSGGISESTMNAAIATATGSLTPAEIGAVDQSAMDTAIQSATETLRFEEHANLDVSSIAVGDIPFVSEIAGSDIVWGVTPQATGGGSITGVEEAPENGVLYVRSNGNWNPMPSYAAPGAYVNPPDLSYFDYEWSNNPASATTEISCTSSYLSVTRTSNSAVDLINFIGADVPSATPWTITAIITCRTAGTQYGRHGLALHETSSHKTIFLGNGNNNYVPQVINGKISSAGVWNSQYGTEIRFYGLSTIYTKITFDGTYYYFYYGLDNFGDFTLYNTVLKSDYFSVEADKIGIMISTGGASVYPYISCSYWDSPDFPAD